MDQKVSFVYVASTMSGRHPSGGTKQVVGELREFI